jgi:hydroxymethylpyrimidine pyrophosphatase-like HAD family hydrolase
VEAIVHPVTKVLAAGTPPVPVETAMRAREAFAGTADVTISHPRFLEFVAPGVSKGRAVRFLARRLRIPLTSVLAIGDQWNDLEMLAAAGHGTAMPTAPAGVQAVARYIAPPLEDEGAGQMIEALALASPDEAQAASRRLTAEAIERRSIPA